MRKNDFAFFLILSFVISVPLFVISTRQTSAGIIVLLFLLGSYAPALAAWIVIKNGGTDEDKSSFRNSLRKWGNSTWILFALFLPSAVWMLAYVATRFLDEKVTPVWASLAGLPVIVIVNYGEEIGWRGYALPYLMKRFSPLTASLIVGIIWGLFHVALNWQRPFFGFLTFCTTLMLSVILAWMYVNTKSILPGTLLHAMFNAWTQVFVSAEQAVALEAAILLLVIVAGFLFVRYGKDLTVSQ